MDFITTDTLILGCESERVTEFPVNQKLIDSMARLGKKGQGISAIQLAVKQRVVLIWTKGKSEYMLLVNPHVKERRGEVEMYETCISRPGVRIKRKRPTYILVEAQDKNGYWFTYEAKNNYARVLQHELDHLNGIYLK